LDSSIERALYGNWLGEVVASAVQGRLLQNAGVGLAGTTIDATAVEDSTIGDDSAGEIPLGTPDPAAYVFPATGLDATDISNGMRSRAASAGVAVKSLDVLSLGAFSAVAVVVRTTTGPTESAADWFSIANELLPASLHDNLVGYYLALEDNTGSPLRINTAGYLADVTTTWVRPDVMAGAGLIAQPVTG
jgi:hypothetical protein